MLLVDDYVCMEKLDAPSCLRRHRNLGWTLAQTVLRKSGDGVGGIGDLSGRFAKENAAFCVESVLETLHFGPLVVSSHGVKLV